VPCRAGRIDELGREGLHPPIDRDVIDLDAAFGQPSNGNEGFRTSEITFDPPV
jgi:hypothetical protein